MLNRAGTRNQDIVDRRVGLPGAAILEVAEDPARRRSRRGMARRVLAGLDTAVTLRRRVGATRPHTRGVSGTRAPTRPRDK